MDKQETGTVEDWIEDGFKPCPRCGGKGVLESGDEIHCNDCGFWTGDEMDDLDEAIEWWNTQPLVDSLQARIAEMVAEADDVMAGQIRQVRDTYEARTQDLERRLAEAGEWKPVPNGEYAGQHLTGGLVVDGEWLKVVELNPNGETYEADIALLEGYRLCQSTEAEPAPVPGVPADVLEAIRAACVQRKHDICNTLEWGTSDDSHEHTQIEWERLTARYDKAIAWLDSVAERSELSIERQYRT